MLCLAATLCLTRPIISASPRTSGRHMQALSECWVWLARGEVPMVPCLSHSIYICFWWHVWEMENSKRSAHIVLHDNKCSMAKAMMEPGVLSPPQTLLLPVHKGALFHHSVADVMLRHFKHTQLACRCLQAVKRRSWQCHSYYFNKILWSAITWHFTRSNLGQAEECICSRY